MDPQTEKSRNILNCSKDWQHSTKPKTLKFRV